MPAGPRVSPTLISTPYFLGISMSPHQMSTPPFKIVQTTPLAPLRASTRSVVDCTLAGYLPKVMISQPPG